MAKNKNMGLGSSSSPQLPSQMVGGREGDITIGTERIHINTIEEARRVLYEYTTHKKSTITVSGGSSGIQSVAVTGDVLLQACKWLHRDLHRTSSSTSQRMSGSNKMANHWQPALSSFATSSSSSTSTSSASGGTVYRQSVLEEQPDSMNEVVQIDLGFPSSSSSSTTTTTTVGKGKGESKVEGVIYGEWELSSELIAVHIEDVYIYFDHNNKEPSSTSASVGAGSVVMSDVSRRTVLRLGTGGVAEWRTYRQWPFTSWVLASEQGQSRETGSAGKRVCEIYATIDIVVLFPSINMCMICIYIEQSSNNGAVVASTVLSFPSSPSPSSSLLQWLFVTTLTEGGASGGSEQLGGTDMSQIKIALTYESLASTGAGTGLTQTEGWTHRYRLWKKVGA